VNRIAPLAIAAALVLAGCAAQPTAAPAPAEAPDTLSGTVTVFAAASLTDSFDEIEAAFEEAHPNVDIVLNYGGSSGLATQIVEGAPADVFAAASPATMKTVVDAGLASDPAGFATNVLELVVPAGNPGGVTGIADLANPDLIVVLCAIEVPCGAASQKVFDATGIVPSVDSYEQDVKAVLTKVELDEADAGLVYLTDVLAAGDAVEGFEFPEAAQAVNLYPIAAVSDAAAAAAFVAWVLSDAGQAVLAEWGFGAP
jgi:molybdate transport system substrate-binding protein